MENNQAIIDLVKGVDGLVTLPHLYTRINQLLDNPNTTTSDIAKAVAHDPAFAIRLLKVANSSYFSFPAKIDTVEKAVSLIGTSQIRSLALAMSVASSFDGLSNDLVSMDNFWRHALYCALIARILAKKAKRGDPEAVFAAALLHDIGELVIFNRLPDQAKQALQLVLDSVDDLPIPEAERQVLGFDHSQVGREMARQWNLPSMLQECIGNHHSIADAVEYPREVALVHLANVFAQMAELDTLNPADVNSIDIRAWQMCGIGADVDMVEEVIREAQEQIVEDEKLFISFSSRSTGHGK